MTEAPGDDIIGIFPTPLMVCRRAVDADLVTAMIAQFEADEATGANVRTSLLTHTPTANPRSHENFVKALGMIGPKIRAYGEALMGESLNWGVKEIWINKMETGGAQKMHNHANSFISGIIYLTETHPASSTVFYRQVGASSFQMSNENERCKITPFNTPIFRAPEVSPGDMVLFPSYVLHEVPPNQGAPRMTAAFNALPERIDSWGYTLHFR